MAPRDPALIARLRDAAQIVADDAKLRSARWSRRVPLSIRLMGGARSVTIVAGGRAAPQAYTMEGYPSGRPISHPVYGRGPSRRGVPVGTDPRTGKIIYDPPGWTWVKQVPRPFLREAIDSKATEMTEAFAKVIDDWAKEKGFK